MSCTNATQKYKAAMSTSRRMEQVVKAEHLRLPRGRNGVEYANCGSLIPPVAATLPSAAQYFRDGPLPLYPAINAMSQNPMKLDQQVPRHIWESHGRGFWMLSTYNMESSRPKLALLGLKEKMRQNH